MEAQGNTKKTIKTKPDGGNGQLRESVRERGEIQPIRDEMELLESERRIFIPGCCTEKREKRERGKKERE